MAPRNGFIVRNAADVSSLLDQAEPDALDFNILGNHRYGVITGCVVTMGVGNSVSVTAGIVVVDGALSQTASTVLALPDPGATPRFDFIIATDTGNVGVIRGASSPNPVFPEYGENVTVLASVLVPPGTTLSQAHVTDKRVMLAPRYKRPLDGGIFLGSYRSSDLAPQYEVSYVGLQRWFTGSTLGETSPLTLTVHENLVVENDLTTEDLVVTDDATIIGDLTALNFRRGNGAPSGPGRPGDLYQDFTNGGVWTYDEGWKAMATTPFEPGFIMESLRDDEPAGWLFLNGQDVEESRAGDLWDLKPQWRVSTPSGPRMRVPDFTNRYMRQGPLGNEGGISTVTLTKANLPPHKHLDDVSGTTQPAGQHAHNITMQPGGQHAHSTVAGQGGHNHPVNDPGHQHFGAWPGGPIIVGVWGGRYKLDGPFNDASHPVAVDALPGVNTADTGITIGGGGDHVHSTNQQGSHVHTATAEPAGGTHSHPIAEHTVGEGVAFDNNPPYACVNYLVKT